MKHPLVLLALGMPLLIQPPSPRQEPPPPLELLHAGNIEYTRNRTGSTVTVCTDSVLFRQGDQYVLSDQATFIDQQEEVRLRGNVRGWEPEWRFRADEVLYRSKERVILATGHVESRRIDDGTLLTARQVRFDRTSGVGTASGSPYLYQSAPDSTGQPSVVTGREGSVLTFQEDGGWAELAGGGSVERGVTRIEGEWMRSENDPRTLRVREKVRLTREGVLAEGISLVWNEDTGQARLLGSPPVLTRRASREAGSLDSVFTVMSADSLDISIREDQLESLHLFGPGSVEMTTRPAPTASPDSVAVPEQMVLKGREIQIRFEEEKISFLEAERAAMYYWRQDAPKRPSALGGLKLAVEFNGGEPSVVTAEGNATTRYFRDPEAVEAEMERAQGALIRLTLEDGALKRAFLTDADARHYSSEMVRRGLVPMAVHPDSIQIAATRPATRPAVGKAARKPPPATGEPWEGSSGR